MSEDSYRQACLHGILVILMGLVVAGFPLVRVVTRDVYHQPIPLDPGGDYRGWLMAHLEGLLNGLLVIAIVAACRGRPMGRIRQRVLLIRA